MILDFIQSLELLCLVVSLMLEPRCCLPLSLGFMSFGGRNIWLKWVKITVYICRGGDDKFTYTFRVTMMVIYCLSMGIQFAISFPLLILLVINYFGFPSVDKNSFQNFFQIKHLSVKEQDYAVFISYSLFFRIFILKIIIFMWLRKTLK